jgi:hypothetical protein
VWPAAVVPPAKELDGVGQDAIVTMGGLRRTDPQATPSVATVTLRSGAPEGTAERLGIGVRNTRPAVIANW